MSLLNIKEEVTQKKVLKILKKRKVWLVKRLNLSYSKPKYFNCQDATEFKISVKRVKYDKCKLFYQCNSTINLKIRRYNAFVYKNKIC